MTLVLPDRGDPEVSAVMVTHNAWPLAERAVAALVAHTDRPFELIVVDNGSDDGTRARLSELRGARVIVNEQNRGFGPASNQGAERANGEYLLLLNSDAYVHPGWLEPLLEAFKLPSVGAAVPRYLHLDGSLQEAGTLLALDGTVMVYGDGDDPDRLSYRFRRIVDFAAAACMLIRRSIFETLGGFDDLFAPAYYEDADLCLRLARHGGTVLYEPRSTVTHARYGSGGRQNAIELSERNRIIFADRWGRHLIGRPSTFRNASKQAVLTARDAVASPRVLICAHAAERGAAHLPCALVEAWPSARVTWATTADGGDPTPWLRAGVELMELGDLSWLSARLFHYDVVVLGSEPDPRLTAALEQTQPQAPRFALSELDFPDEILVSRAIPLLAGAGIAPPAATAA